MGSLESRNQETDLVVYVWYDKDTPFYIGKGKLGREIERGRGRNRACCSKRAKAEENNTFTVKILAGHLTNNEASALERNLIKILGTVNSGGPLLNFTEGGDGGDTWTFRSDEERALTIQRIKKAQQARLEKMSNGGKVGGLISAQINKKKLQGPWDPNWINKGHITARIWLENNKDVHREFSRKGARSLWANPKQKEVNAQACAKTGKANKGSRWITNGSMNKKLMPGQTMPEDFYFGRS